MLPLDEPSRSLAHDIQGQPVKVPLSPYLLLAAVLLFPVDVAVRRLTFSWKDLRPGRGKGEAGR